MAKRVNLSTRLKRWRKAKGFTLEVAASELGLKTGTYIEYESGRRGKKMNQLLYDTLILKTELEPSK